MPSMRCLLARGFAAQQFLGAFVVLDGGPLGEEGREPLLYVWVCPCESGVEGRLVGEAEFQGLAAALPPGDLTLVYADQFGERFAGLARGFSLFFNFRLSRDDAG